MELNLDKKSARRGTKTIDLTAKEFSLLEFLMRNRSRVVSRADIAEKVWDITFDTDTNVVDVYINILRKKLDKDFEKKLTYQFIGIVAVILLFSLVVIYLLFAKARKEEFYDRLDNKARLVAQMLIDIDEINPELLKRLKKIIR